MELPEFKYSPNAYKLDIIVKENIVCECCGEKREYRYDGPFYAEEEIEEIKELPEKEEIIEENIEE